MSERIEEKKGWRLQELAHSHGTSIGFWRCEIKRGALIARKCGRSVIVLDSDLQTYLDQRRISGKAPSVDLNPTENNHVDA